MITFTVKIPDFPTSKYSANFLQVDNSAQNFISNYEFISPEGNTIERI